MDEVLEIGLPTVPPVDDVMPVTGLGIQNDQFCSHFSM